MLVEERAVHGGVALGLAFEFWQVIKGNTSGGGNT